MIHSMKSSRALHIGLVASVLVGCGARVSVDSSDASGGTQTACCVEGLDSTGDPCGPANVGVCRGAPLECWQWCMNASTGACEPKLLEAPSCGSPCPETSCPPQ